MKKSTDAERRERIRRWHTRGRAGNSKPDSADPNAADGPSRAQPTGTKRRLWVILLICLAGSSAVSFAAFKFLMPAIPSELLGTWQVTEGPLRGATLEFGADGRAIATRHVRGKKEVTHSTFTVEGKKLFLTSTEDETGKNDTVRQTIVTLTDEEFVLRDEDKNTFRMKRLRN